MSRTLLLLAGTALVLQLLVFWLSLPTPVTEAARAVRAGGDLTVDTATTDAFAVAAPGLAPSQKQRFAIGRDAFNATFVPADDAARGGLGPRFNSASCESCHLRNGRSSHQLVLHVSLPGAGPHGGPRPIPGVGTQLQNQAVSGFEPEGRIDRSYRDSTVSLAGGERVTLRVPRMSVANAGRRFPHNAQISPRAALPVFGMGLLDAVSDTTLQAIARRQAADGDSISGRPNHVWNPATGRMETGRFGWKATQATLRQQTVDAFHVDMGITPPGHPVPDGADDAPEISRRIVDATTFYTRSLAVPARRHTNRERVRRGREVFERIGCATCHRPTMTSGPSPELSAAAHQTFSPFTDLLLHDMGPALADGRPAFEASGSEWRTPPLWGLGLRERVQGHSEYLHDGRARTLLEAILWHGGEARPTRERFRDLSEADRGALLRFLRSL